MVHKVTRESRRIEKHQWVLDRDKDEISIKISPNLSALGTLVPSPPKKLTYLCLLRFIKGKMAQSKIKLA